MIRGALGATAGGAVGAGLGESGRSPLLSLLAPLDYPRQAAWNLAHRAGKLASGDGEGTDILGMLPAILGGGLGFALGGPFGAAAGAGLAQGLGNATGAEEFEAPTTADAVEGLGGDRDSMLLNMLVGMAGDPLTYAGMIGGARMAKTAPESLLAGDAKAIQTATSSPIKSQAFESIENAPKGPPLFWFDVDPTGELSPRMAGLLQRLTPRTTYPIPLKQARPFPWTTPSDPSLPMSL